VTEVRRTDSRAIALAQVQDGEVLYDSQGNFLEKGAKEELLQVAGPRRRTFAELREAGLITPGAPSGAPVTDPLSPIVPMLATDKGVKTLAQWDLTSH
jgi:hypothetical protein